VVRDAPAAELEGLLAEARALAVIGRLTQGVVHTFNNGLTAILSHVEVALMAAEDPGLREDLECILEVTRSSAELLEQLAALSARGRGGGCRLDEVLSELQVLLEGSLGANISVSSSGGGGAHLAASRGEVERLLITLALAARDAMPRGGEIHLGAEESPDAPGRVALTLSCDGALGSEPRGPLGLDYAAQLAHSRGGALEVRGGRAAVSLPRAEAARGQAPTVLLIEDDPKVLELLQQTLRSGGLEVLSAASAEEGLGLIGGSARRLDLLVADVVMPGIGGAGLARWLLSERPELPVIFVSGFAGQELDGLDLTPRRRALLYKPFTGRQLLELVAAMLAPGG
jgi:two-component system cell cycle sensor histidine kinase/response regulator CckA